MKGNTINISRYFVQINHYCHAERSEASSKKIKKSVELSFLKGKI
jgi:hypothetical protein